MFTFSSPHPAKPVIKLLKLRPFDGDAVWRARYIAEALGEKRKYCVRCLTLENLPVESTHGRLYISMQTKGDTGFKEQYTTKEHSERPNWSSESSYMLLDRTDTLRIELNSKSSIIGRKRLVGVRDVKLPYVFNKGKAPNVQSCMHYPIAGVEILVKLSFDRKEFPMMRRAKLTLGVTPCREADSPILTVKQFKRTYNKKRSKTKTNEKKYVQAKKDAAEIISKCELDGVFLSEVGGLSQNTLENLYANTFGGADGFEVELETADQMAKALTDAGCLDAILSELMGLEAGRDCFAEALALFNALDINGDGRISFRELVVSLGALVCPTDDNRSQRATLIFKAMDVNSDGGISYKELKRWMKGFITLSIKRFMATFERQLLKSSAVNPGTLSRAMKRMRVLWEDLDKETLDHLLSMAYSSLELDVSEQISLEAWETFYSNGEKVQEGLLAFILPKVKAALCALLEGKVDGPTSSSSETSDDEEHGGPGGNQDDVTDKFGL